MINRRDLAFGALGAALTFLIFSGSAMIFSLYFAEGCTAHYDYVERNSITNDRLDPDPYKQLEKMKEYYGDRWIGGIYDEEKDQLGFCYLRSPPDYFSDD
ncbi:MAG: hypothetical protein ACR2LL_05840 [Nitrosopumilus sp.]